MSGLTTGLNPVARFQGPKRHAKIIIMEAFRVDDWLLEIVVPILGTIFFGSNNSNTENLKLSGNFRSKFVKFMY